jgi:hypothetical protein
VVEALKEQFEEKSLVLNSIRIEIEKILVEQR